MTTENLTFEKLERTSKNWDRQTKEILLYLKGSGDMFGGSTQFLHITLHGDNSLTPTGTITVNGLAKAIYNIARGENGGNYQILSYYKGANGSTDTRSIEHTYRIKIDGRCGGCEEALCSILNAEKDWLIKN
jgi:hypothetical protein